MADASAAQGERPDKRRRRSSKEVEAIIIRAAQEIFAEVGYEGATMREVARRSGIHEPTLYRHFPSKDSLFDAAVFAQFDKQLLGVYENAAATAPSDTEGLVPVLDPMLSFMRSDRRLVITALDRTLRPDARDKGIIQRSASLVEALIDKVSPLLEQHEAAQPFGGKDAAPALVALMLSSAIGLALLEPILEETRYSLSPESMVRQMAKRRMSRVGLDVANLSDEGSVKVIELIHRVLDANRAASQAQVELEHLARWGSTCPQNGGSVSFGPHDIEAHLHTHAG